MSKKIQNNDNKEDIIDKIWLAVASGCNKDIPKIFLVSSSEDDILKKLNMVLVNNPKLSTSYELKTVRDRSIKKGVGKCKYKTKLPPSCGNLVVNPDTKIVAKEFKLNNMCTLTCQYSGLLIRVYSVKEKVKAMKYYMGDDSDDDIFPYCNKD